MVDRLTTDEVAQLAGEEVRRWLTARRPPARRDHRHPSRARNKTLTWSDRDQAVLDELRARIAARGQGVPCERDVIAAALRVALRHADALELAGADTETEPTQAKGRAMPA